MLKSLTIRNYAIIDEAEIHFSDQLNIITGETGAGKSILLGALSLILGERADSQVLRNANEKCVVEGVFQIGHLQLASVFEHEELDYQDETIIRREILPTGKSRAFINDTPTSLRLLKTICSLLIDVHSQHETIEMNEAAYQIQLIDSVAMNQALVAKYKQLYDEYNRLQKQYDALLQMKENAAREADFIIFQLNELEEVALDHCKQDDMEQELKTIQSAEEINIRIEASTALLNESEYNIQQRITELLSQLRSVKDIHPQIQGVYERLQSTQIELKDIGREVELMRGEFVFDEERANTLQQKLSEIYRLEKKHGVQSIEQLIQIRDTLKFQHSSYQNMDDDLETMSQQIATTIQQLQRAADELYRNRHAVIPSIEKQVVEIVSRLGMSNARFSITHDQHMGEYKTHGNDSLQFMFSANTGTPLMNIKKVASGGELSRLMLSIKSMLAQATSLPSMIFDEIDTGISGQVAAKTGEIIKQMSRKHQIICITHLPQIAAKGQKHFYIYKEVVQQQTYTRVRELDETERIQEIAAMLGGDSISDASIANARELLVSN